MRFGSYSMAATVAGTYDLRSRDLHLVEAVGQSDPRMEALAEEVDLVRAALPEFEREGFLAGHLTPVFFGSAIKEIGVSDLLDALAAFGPPPRAQPADSRTVQATEERLTAFQDRLQKTRLLQSASVTLDPDPASAAAAAIAGLTRCVRPPRPCRPSKLRLLVDADRSPG